MHNMLLRPTAAELAEFGDPDYVIYNAGQFPANPHTTQMTSKTSIALSLERREYVILGTEYAGEMKKGIFTLMHYVLPQRGVLSMHCSANEGPAGDVSLFFGLSGTGKTTLSADPARRLIGDDEHGWSDDGVFNIEGGCYAKCIHLSAEKEPEIYGAIRFGTVLENTVYDPVTREVDFDSAAITENTRAAYPIEFIPNAKIPCVGGHPRNIIFLTCDASGVLPPVSKLTPAQAMYHFISGYTARVAGTEQGVKEPQPAFSACFSAAFLVRHPTVYAEMLAAKLRKHGVQTWLRQHRLERRTLRRRLADEAFLHAGDHRRHPRRHARRLPDSDRRDLRPCRPNPLPRRPGRNAATGTDLVRCGSLRPSRQKTRHPFPRKLRQIRRPSQRRNPLGGAAGVGQRSRQIAAWNRTSHFRREQQYGRSNDDLASRRECTNRKLDRGR